MTTGEIINSVTSAVSAIVAVVALVITSNQAVQNTKIDQLSDVLLAMNKNNDINYQVNLYKLQPFFEYAKPAEFDSLSVKLYLINMGKKGIVTSATSYRSGAVVEVYGQQSVATGETFEIRQRWSDLKNPPFGGYDLLIRYKDENGASYAQRFGKQYKLQPTNQIVTREQIDSSETN